MPCCPKQRLHHWSHSLLQTPTHTFHFQGLVNTLWPTSCLGSIPILRGWNPFTRKTCHPTKNRKMEFPSKMLHSQAAQWSHVLSPISWGLTTATVGGTLSHGNRKPWNFSHGYFTLMDQTQLHVSAWGGHATNPIQLIFCSIGPFLGVKCVMWDVNKHL